jgi:hypothetical protein
LQGQVLGESNAETPDGFFIERRLVGAASNAVGSKKSFHVPTFFQAMS